MATTDVFVEVEAVRNPRHLSSMVTGVRKNGQLVQDAMLTVYTGLLELDIDESNNSAFERFNVITYVLMNIDDPNDFFFDDKRIVDYTAENNDVIDAVATATVSTFADRPESCGVDRVSVVLREHLFKDAVKRFVLELRVRASLRDGKIFGIAYHVTTLSEFPRGVPTLIKPVSDDRPGLRI